MSEADIRQYEKSFADVHNCSNAFAFWKGRVALYAILKALGVGPGDEVILPGYTCVVDVNPIKYLGAKPAYIDIEPDTFNMNVNLLGEKITSKTKVIIAQHTYGYPCEMDAIMDIAGKHRIQVVEDCCLAFGSRYKGKLLGTFGQIAYFSSQWNKTYTTGLGGMAVTSNPESANKLKEISDQLIQPSQKQIFMLAVQLAVYRAFIYPRTTAFAQTIFRWLTEIGVMGSSSIEEYVAPNIPENFFCAMSSVQARAGLRQLKKIEQNFEHRKKTVLLYQQLLAEAGWKIKALPDHIDPILVRYPVRITEKEKAVKSAARAGIEIGTWFDSPLHQCRNLQNFEYYPGMCSQGEKAAEQVVNLPLHPRVTGNTVRKTIDFISKFQQAE